LKKKGGIRQDKKEKRIEGGRRLKPSKIKAKGGKKTGGTGGK